MTLRVRISVIRVGEYIVVSSHMEGLVLYGKMAKICEQ